MLVELKDLEIGDEILIPSQVDFKRLKIERKPVQRVATLNGYQSGYKNVKCSIRNNNVGGEWASYDCTNEEYNDTISIDLNYRKIWLIKKGKR